MIITPAKLADFYSTHNYDAETCIAHWLAAYSGWELVYAPARVNFPDWDFVLVDPVSKAAARGEIKISSKGPMGGFLELSRGNGDPSGLSATRADFYLFLNAGTGNRGKVRLVRTHHLQQYAATRQHAAIVIAQSGDRLGSRVIPLDLTASQLKDLMIAEIPWDAVTKSFNFDPSEFSYNSYSKTKIRRFLQVDNWK